MTMFEQLAAEFPKSAVSWRAQTVTKAGDKALALAYIDARDVMNRLDDVCGPENWKDRYEFNGNTAICYLSIRVNNEWIEKADGAGSTDVEAEKGQISDAFKRAAVRWKIGRYLYDMPATWVPCESYEKNGKFHWSKWKGDPWDSVRMPSKAPERQPEAPKPEAPKITAAAKKELWASLMNDLKVESAKGTEAITRFMNDAEVKADIARLSDWSKNFREEAASIYKIAKEVENEFGQSVEVKSNYTPPNFDNLGNAPTVGDILDELMTGTNAGAEAARKDTQGFVDG